MLDAFKIQPFDLEPIYASWPDAPHFVGNPKKDLPVDEWLKKIKEGCKQRNVPKEYWHKVAQHYMADHAKARLDELKLVMSKVHDGKYRWNWERYKIAMRNMGWNIDVAETESVKVHTKRSGFWWITRKGENNTEVSEPATPIVEVAEPPAIPKPKRSSTMPFETLARKMTFNKEKETELEETPVLVTAPSPAASSSFWPIRKGSLDDVKRPLPPQKAASDTIVTRDDANTAVTVAHAPIWLVNACNALDFLQTEHPKVMSSLAAILITVGTLPTIPALAAGAGGAVLASGAVQAVGAIAVGLGTLLKTHQDLAQGNSSAAGTQSK